VVNLLFYAWERYGALGTGINTTTEQVRKRAPRSSAAAWRQGGSPRAPHFREVPRQFDKLLSIGTLEHAGPTSFRRVIRAHAEYLKPGGLGVIHFIGHVGVRDTEFWIRQSTSFPAAGSEPYRGDRLCERCGLEIVDIENLRRNYALHARRLGRRFDRNWERVHNIIPGKFDERFRPNLADLPLVVRRECSAPPMARRTSSRS